MSSRVPLNNVQKELRSIEEAGKRIRESFGERDFAITDALVKLEKCEQALFEIIDNFDSVNNPTPEAALVAKTKDLSQCTNEEKFSFEYYNEYSKLMWLANVAFDYCHGALRKINGLIESSEGGEDDE